MRTRIWDRCIGSRKPSVHRRFVWWRCRSRLRDGKKRLSSRIRSHSFWSPRGESQIKRRWIFHSPGTELGKLCVKWRYGCEIFPCVLDADCQHKVMRGERRFCWNNFYFREEESFDLIFYIISSEVLPFVKQVASFSTGFVFSAFLIQLLRSFLIDYLSVMDDWSLWSWSL